MLENMMVCMMDIMKNIINEREKFFNYINKHLSNIYQDISGTKSKIEIIYKKCSDIDEEVMTDLEKETIKDEYLYDEVLEEDNDNSQK